MSDVNLPSILNNDLTDTSAAYPILPAGNYNVTISEIKAENAKLKEGQSEPGVNLVISVKTDQPYKDREGKQQNAGFTLTDRVSLSPTEKYTTDMIERRLKEILIAVFGEDVKGSFGQYYRDGLLVKKSVVIKLAIETDATGAYPDRNRIARYVRKV